MAKSSVMATSVGTQLAGYRRNDMLVEKTSDWQNGQIQTRQVQDMFIIIEAFKNTHHALPLPCTASSCRL